jgi:hypothetical protein
MWYEKYLLTKEKRVPFTLNVKLYNAERMFKDKHQSAERMPIVRFRPRALEGRDVVGYLIWKQERIFAPSLELGCCLEEVCGEAARWLRSFGVMQK